jgi:hypothetical protein
VRESHPRVWCTESQAAADGDERRDLRGVPQHRRKVGKKEMAVAVLHAQAPRGQDEEPHTGEDDLDQRNGEGAHLALKAGRDHVNQQRRPGDTARHRERHDEQQRREHDARDLVGFGVAPFRAQPTVDGDERGREHPFAEQVL